MIKSHVVEMFYELVKMRSTENILKLFTQEASLSFPDSNPIGGFYLGKDKIKRFLKKLFSISPDLSFEIYNTLSSDELVFVEWGFSGTTRKGNPMDGKGISIFETEGEQIKEMRTYMDFSL